METTHFAIDHYDREREVVALAVLRAAFLGGVYAERLVLRAAGVELLLRLLQEVGESGDSPEAVTGRADEPIPHLADGLTAVLDTETDLKRISKLRESLRKQVASLADVDAAANRKRTAHPSRRPAAAPEAGPTPGCVGIDIDPERIKEARENVRKNKVEHLVTIEQKDIFTLDLSPASVVTLYLLPDLNVKLIPKLNKELKPGTRIVPRAPWWCSIQRCRPPAP